MTTFDVSRLPTVNLACMVIYDAFVTRGLRENGVRLPEEKLATLSTRPSGNRLLPAFPTDSQWSIRSGSRLAGLSSSIRLHPSRRVATLLAVGRYLLVPSALVSAAVCLVQQRDLG